MASRTRTVGAAAVAGLLLASLVACGAGAERSGQDTVPCAEAMRFADQDGLPAGARDATCVSRGGIDTLYDVRFRIGRADLDTWLDDAYPGLRMSGTCADGTADRCGHADLHPYAKGGAVAVDLSVRYEGDEALVSYRPFNT
ncbi:MULTISPECIES: hypothetical protein [Streptomyces]|uniref:DUF4333 domain-containing protein n=1 Tax=Streptomyces doudnae TaxID=3075536 RepID=A0ABD5ENL1_9ACTN|nr:MULTISPECIES: hypothetical protein [unclassified Streptomyces]MDT0436191.1 hypothetical protein [Streptomyces sp. DSM 41981]MYQ65672.1 hypothetical protein [Streptomyces sp. SID4950]SCE05286.1 hypothetical protein GA0115242_12092 [Streptomyces sp. SolWspMP-5a-2]